MAESSSSSGAPSPAAPAYVPPRSRGKLIGVVIAVLVVTNAITGLTVYYASAPAPTTVAVKVIGPWAGNTPGSEWLKFKPVLDMFTNTTGIPYSYTPTRQEDLQPILPISFQAQQSPADLIFMPSSYILQWAAKGWVADLSGTLSTSTYQAGALSPVTVNGTIWGGAYTGKVKPGFWYNVSWFQAHSLPDPTQFTSWSQLMNLLWTVKNITGVSAPMISGDGVGWPLSDVVEGFLETYGGASMNQALMNHTLKWTDPSVEAIFSNYIVPTLEDGFWSQPITWDVPGVSLWWSGQYPLYFMGSWITGMVPNPSDLGVFSLPGGVSSNQGIVFAADYFFVPKYAEHPALAKRLAQFLASEAAQEEQVKQGGHIATAAGVPLSAYPTVDRKVASLLGGKVVLPDLDDTIGGTFQPYFWSELQKLWATPTSWQTILGEIETAAEHPNA